ncbi:hypothetical protein I4U23_013575 [Adineta vaga]|nr:hypothetical protein I4U23_013575 [Adineta vaga]
MCSLFFFEDCRARFDFTQHTREACDGKCWKLVDLIETRTFENNTLNALLRRDADLFKLRSSRRCFSATELLRAAEMGVNTSDGCRQVQKRRSKNERSLLLF